MSDNPAPQRIIMSEFSGNWNYPKELPVVEHREEILDALKSNQVIVVGLLHPLPKTAGKPRRRRMVGKHGRSVPLGLSPAWPRV